MKRRIKINKLFGMYTNDIDLSNRCSILIGENGVGKSTILNILQSISNHDYIQLSAHYFESIELITDDKRFKIMYKDLFPTLDYLVKSLPKHVKVEYTNTFNENDVCLTNFEHIVIALNSLKAASKENYLYQFLSSSYFGIASNKWIKKIVENVEFNVLNVSPTNVIKEIMSELVTENRVQKNPFSNEDVKCTHRYFSNSKISKETSLNKLDQIIELLDFNNIFYLDMVNRYRINSDLVYKSVVFSESVSGLRKLSNPLSRDFLDRPIMPNTKSVYGLPSCNESIVEYLMEIAKAAYTNIHYEFIPKYSKIRDGFLKTLDTDQFANINTLINRNYYPEEVIKEINNTAISYYKNYIGEDLIAFNTEAIDINKLFDFYANAQITNELYLYLMPIVLNDSIFKESLPGLYNIEYIAQHNDYGSVGLYNFYVNEFEKYKNKKSEKIKTLQHLLDKYITNKSILITPAGIIVSKLNSKSYTKDKFNIISNEENEIELDSLSSGEKKILILFMLAIFFEEKTIIIDEPELSLSITWQEQLLPDILEHTNVKRIIVATHSPFIANDESLIDSIVLLPTKEDM